MLKFRPILWAVVFGACSQRAVSAVEPTDTTVCELVGNSSAFSGKMVRVRAEVKTGFEIAVIQAECDRKAASMALYYPDLVRDSDRPDFSLLKDQNFKQFDQALSKLGWGLEIGQSSRPPGVRVTATLVGRFDGPDKLRVTDSAGRTVVKKGYGFTPSTLYQTRLILKCVSDVTVSK